MHENAAQGWHGNRHNKVSPLPLQLRQGIPLRQTTRFDDIRSDPRSDQLSSSCVCCSEGLSGIYKGPFCPQPEIITEEINTSAKPSRLSRVPNLNVC